MPNYRRHYVLGHPVFLTIVTADRVPWLGDPANARLLLDSMRRTKVRYPYRHLAHVVMPDHLHWILVPADADFSRIVAAVKRDVTWRLKGDPEAARKRWQARFYDHVIRDTRDLYRHLDYVHYNPVKHGVSSSPSEHGVSSFAAWCERGVYEREWGRVEPKDISDLKLE